MHIYIYIYICIYIYIYIQHTLNFLYSFHFTSYQTFCKIITENTSITAATVLETSNDFCCNLVRYSFYRWIAAMKLAVFLHTRNLKISNAF